MSGMCINKKSRPQRGNAESGKPNLYVLIIEAKKGKVNEMVQGPNRVSQNDVL